jgi:hydrophobic/amphiphilic exporter-1 (mainly G- bacteria), HAE1 family
MAEALARLAARRPVAVTVLAALIVVLGIASWRGLPLDLLPDVQSPTVLVFVSSGERPAVEMERLYGERIEQLLFTVRGLRDVSQIARSGELITRVTFDWGTNVDIALVDVNKAVAPIAADVDVDEVRVRRFDPRQLPVLVLGLVSADGRTELAELRRLAERQIGPALEQLRGVAEVRVTGGREKQIQVRLDRTRVEAYGLTIDEIRSRIAATNVDVNAGTLTEGDRVLLVRGLSRFTEPEDVANTVVRYEARGAQGVVPIHVGDLGQVVLADAEITHVVRVDGVEGVGLSIYKESDENTVAVSRVVREALNRLGADLPGLQIRTIADEAALVEDAIADVENAALIGLVLAVAVLFLFLRSAAPVVMVVAVIPVALLATVLAMNFAGYSLNLLTLGGLALGAGILVDNTIVVTESIFRRRAEGDSPIEAATKGTAAVAGAIVASTLTTCVVFLPVVLIEGMAARLVGGIAFTVVLSMLASLVVAMTLIPALSAWLLPRKRTRDVDPGNTRVEALVYRLTGRPWPVVLVSAGLAAVAIAALLRLGTELLPPADPRQFSVRIVGPPGQRVESTVESVAVIESVLRQEAGPDLSAILSEVGRLPNDDRLIREQQTEENTAEIRLLLAASGVSGGEVVQRAAPIVSHLHGIEASWEVGSTALARALGTAGPPIVVEIAGDSIEDLRLGAERMRASLARRPELWNVQSSFEGGPPEMRIQLKRAIADGSGVDLPTIGAVIESSLEGLRATTMTMGDEEREVVLKLPRTDVEALRNLPFQTSTGRRITVGEVADLVEAEGAREIFRRDQRRIAQVTARIAPGISAPVARESALSAMAAANVPQGLRVELAGEETERGRTTGELRWAAVLALLLVFMVLAGSFESLLVPITILSAIPLSLIGVALVLVPIDKPIGIMSMLGLITLAGVAVNDAILLAQAARKLIEEGVEQRRALARAASLRLRPIIMTTATSVLALAPLALGVGEAAELRSPLALTVISGLVASMFCSLLVIPCVYVVLGRIGPRRRRALQESPTVAGS